MHTPQKAVKDVERQMKMLRKQKKVIDKGWLRFVLIWGVCAFGLNFAFLFIILTRNQEWSSDMQGPIWWVFIYTRLKLIGISLAGGVLFGIKGWNMFLNAHEITKTGLINMMGEEEAWKFFEKLEDQI